MHATGVSIKETFIFLLEMRRSCARLGIHRVPRLMIMVLSFYDGERAIDHFS